MVLRHSSSLTLLLLAGVAIAGSSRRGTPVVHRPARLARAATCPALPSGAGPDVDLSVSLAFDYNVSVSPPGGSASWPLNTNGHVAIFTVTNTGNCSDGFSLTPSTTGGVITGVTRKPTSTSLSSGASMQDTVTYNVTIPGSGTLILSAHGNRGLETSSGSYPVTVTSNGPVVSLAPHNGAYRDVTQCVAACFDVVAGYATPPYFSWDTPRSVRLVYRSAQARPMGVFQVNAWDTSTVHPIKMSLALKKTSGVSVTFLNNNLTELFFACDSTGGAIACDSTWNRLAGQFYDSTLLTNDSSYTAILRSYRADQTVRENDVPVRVFMVNESASPFGAGWSIAGFQHLFTQLDGTSVITDGTGSIALFNPQPGCLLGCTWTSPNGDFSTLSTLGSVGADSAKYTRRYPDGTIVAFYTNGRADYVKDRFNNQTTFKYNTSQQLVAIVDPAGKADSLGYVSNKLRWIKDPGGRVDSITVDASGNLTRIKDWAGLLPFQGQYDTKHRLTHWTDRRGGAWGLSYDFAGKLATDTAPQITANGQAVKPVVGYASLEKAVLIDPASGLGGSSTPAPHVNSATVRATVTNAKGFSTSFALDRFGAPTLVQEPLGRTTTYTRDSNAHVLRVVSPSSRLTKYTWSGPNLTQQWDSSSGRQINYLNETTYNQDTLVYGDVQTVQSRWHSGHLDSTRTGSSGWAKYHYAATGRIVADTDPGAHTKTYHYQATGFQNVDTVHYTIGKTSFQYSGHGEQIQTTDAAGKVTTVKYDSIGRLVRTVGARQDTTVDSSDALYVIKIRDAKNQTYRSWVNALGWTDSTTDPGGRVDHYQYDLNGNRTSWTDRRGQTIQFTYDSLNQPRLVIAGSDTTKLFADPAGRFSAVTNRESVDSVKTDSASRFLWQISCRVLATGGAPQCFRDSSAYSIRNQDTVLAITAPTLWADSQFAVRYHYTSDGRLDTLTNFGGEKAAFLYNAELLEQSHTLLGLNNLNVASNGYVWTHQRDQLTPSDSGLNVALGWGYQYDSLGRVMKAKHGPWVTPDTIRTVTYDAASEVVGYEDDRYTYGTQIDSSCTRGLAGDPCPDTSNVQDITVVRSGSYGYDSVGNRKDSSSAGGLDPGNRLRRWHYLRMDYDGAGNLTRKRTLSPADTTKSLRTDSLFWGALGRVDSAHTRDSLGALTRVGFGYDGWGRRIRKSTVGGTSRYVWDGHALAMELDTLGHRVAEYTYYPGTDTPESVLRHDRQDTTYYYLQDGLGRVVALLKRTGTNTAIANRYAYDPFGAPQGGSSTVPNTIQFAGREYDAETQLYYNRARYYDPTVGRFVSEDPAGLGAGINPYMYAANDPVNGRDPSGMFTDDYDGMKNREWRLMRFRGPHISPWGALLDLHGMLDDIAMVGVPHYQEPVHYASMQEAVMGGCDINGGGGIPSGAGTAAHPNPNGPNCTATSLTGTEPTSGPPFDKCFSQYFDVMLDAVAVGVSAPFAIADPEPISRIAGAAGATVALGALKKDQDRWMKCEGH